MVYEKRGGLGSAKNEGAGACLRLAIFSPTPTRPVSHRPLLIESSLFYFKKITPIYRKKR